MMELRYTVELLITHTPRETPKSMAYQGLWAMRDVRVLSARLGFANTYGL